MPKLFCANPLCGGEIIPSTPFQQDCIFDGKKWWHTNCFKETFPNKKIDKWFEKTEKYITESSDKEALYSYIVKEYDIPDLSSSLKKKIDTFVNGLAIVDGESNYSKLLDMFQYYYTQLAQSRDYRRRSNIEGMEVTGYGEPCVRYDLNTLASKVSEYDSRMSLNKIVKENNNKTFAIKTPDMTPYYKEQYRKDLESGAIAVQNMLDNMWDEMDKVDCTE